MWKGKLLNALFFSLKYKMNTYDCLNGISGRVGFGGVSALSFFAFIPLKQCWDINFLSQSSSHDYNYHGIHDFTVLLIKQFLIRQVRISLRVQVI